ncbi:site-specific integrase, partial [Bifidobacterium longum]|uniref:site-specific integrase n=1 Tax=Bifidobacterium longum TaxID=216816 RepID=UPI001F6053D7
MSKARKTAASSGEPDFWRVARDWLHHWLPKVRGSSPKTVEAYRIGLESYVRWLETTEGTQRSHIGFGHFDRARLGRWVEWMRTERGYSDRTIMLRMTTMRVFLDHAGLEHPALTALGNDAAGIRVKPVFCQVGVCVLCSVFPQWGVVTFCWTSLSVWSLVSVPDGFRRRARAG